MSSQKVFFPRNILATIALFPIFISLGVLMLHRLLKAAVARTPSIDTLSNTMQQWLGTRTPVKYQNHRTVTAALITALLVILLTPIDRVLVPNIQEDSRNTAVRWIDSNIPAGATIFLPLSLGLDIRTFSVKYKLKPVDFRQGNAREIFQQLRRQDCYVIAPEFRFRQVSQQNRSLAEKTNSKIEVLLKGFESLEKFGTTPLLINTNYKSSWYEKEFTYMPVANRQPLFTVYKGPGKPPVKP